MKAINTMPQEEYNRRLCEAAKRMFNAVSRLMDKELTASTKADNAGQEEVALKHDFNARALQLATSALLITPTSL